MYSLLRRVPKKQLVVELMPTLAVSIAIAELFYKFHSFTLECLAFLATWFVVDAVTRRTIDALRGERPTPDDEPSP